MEMTVLVAALGIAALWIVGQARSEYYRVGRMATTMVVLCVAALQAYFLRYAIRTDPFYLPWPLVITGQLLMYYAMLLHVTRGRHSTPIRVRAYARQPRFAENLRGQLGEQELKNLVVCDLALPKQGH
jgi:hypothetical protein